MRKAIALVLAGLVSLTGPGCNGLGGPTQPGKPTSARKKPTPSPKVEATPPLGVGNPVDSGQAGIVSHNGAGLIGKVKIPAGIISNNAGSLISEDGLGLISEDGLGLISEDGMGLISEDGLGLIGNNAGNYRTQAVTQLPFYRVPVVLVTANGTPIRDAAGKPYATLTDKTGGYSFTSTPTGQSFMVRVLLPKPVGDMYAYLSAEKAAEPRTVDVDLTSTLVMGYIANEFVKGDPTILGRLSAVEEAETREIAEKAIGDAEPVVRFQPEVLKSGMEALRKKDAALDKQVEHVKELLLLGKSNLGDGDLATHSSLNGPAAIAFDKAGRMAIADKLNNRVRLVDAAGKIRTIAGSGGVGFGGDGGPATAALLSGPEDVLFDDAGNLYVADGTNGSVRRVKLDGTIETVAGTGVSGTSIASAGPARSTTLGRPVALAWDTDRKHLFIADNRYHMVYRLTPDGQLEIFAGRNTNPLTSTTENDIDANQTEMISPLGLAVDPAGNVYVTRKDNPALIRKIDRQSHRVSTLTLTGPEKDLLAPSKMAFGPDGALYVADRDHYRIAKIVDGVVTTVAGQYRQIGADAGEGQASAITLARPEGLAFDASGRLVVADTLRGLIRRLEPDGRLVNVAGLTNLAQVDGDNLALSRPSFMTQDSAGNLYISDSLNAVVRKRTPDGKMTVFAGNGVKLSAGDGGAASKASFTTTGGLAFDKAGNLYVVDGESGVVRKIAPDGIISTFATGLVSATAIAIDSKGQLYVSGSDRAHGVWRVGTDGTVQPLTQIVIREYSSGDGGAAIDATLNTPGGLAVDAQDNLYICEVKGQRVRKVTPDGKISTVYASIAIQAASGEVTMAPKANFLAPGAIMIGPDGSFYISDVLASRVVKISPAGESTVIAGAGGKAFTGSGVDDGLKQPLGLAFDQDGNLVVVDSGNNQVKLVPKAQLP